VYDFTPKKEKPTPSQKRRKKENDINQMQSKTPAVERYKQTRQ